MPPCVCSINPLASNVETLTAVAAAAASEFMNPVTLHTIAAVGSAGIAAAERFSSSTPVDGVKTADTPTFGGLRLEHEADAAVALRAGKRNPVRDMSLRAVAWPAGAMRKGTVMTTPVVFAK